MPRLASAIAVALMLASAFFLYGVKYDTRRIEIEVQAREKAAERAHGDIAVLKAERAHLARPERIEPLARAQGLGPPAAGQYQRLGGAAAPGSAAGP